MNKLTLIILAAGKGSRYGGAKQTDSLGLNGESMMDFTIYDAILAGFNHIVFIIQENQKDYFKQKYERLSEKVMIDYAIQDISRTPFDLKHVERCKPWGTSHALWSAKAYVDSPFCVLNADDFYGRSTFLSMANFLRSNKESQTGALIVYPLSKTMSDHGSVSRGCCTIEDGKLKAITEVLSIQVIENKVISESSHISMDTFVSMNMWGFMPEALKVLESKLLHFADDASLNELATIEALLPSDVQSCIADRTLSVVAITTDEDWFGITYKEDKDAVSFKLQTMQKEKYYPTTLFECF